MRPAPTRLVEIGPPVPGGPGNSGSGWALGTSGVLTACSRHGWYADTAGSPGRAVIRGRGSTAVCWRHPRLDIALLEVSPARVSARDPRRRLRRGSRPWEITVVAEAIGFPDA